MLELYQFELCPYCEKVRLILDYKGLAYRKIEVTPGIGQIEVYQLSGQRKVPVLKDDYTVVTDSTAIAKYLDSKYPDRPIIPQDPKQRSLCLLIEEWADTSLGAKSPKALFGAISQDTSFRTSILPNGTPDLVKDLVGAVPSDIFNFLGAGIGLSTDAIQTAREDLQQDLETLTQMLQDKPYLVADTPTLADLAVAALSITIKYPSGNYFNIPENLRHKGIPGFADNPIWDAFFNWRDRLYSQYRQPLGTTGTGGSSPTAINID